MLIGTVWFGGAQVLGGVGGPSANLCVSTHEQEEIFFRRRLWKRIRVADHAFRSTAKRRNARSFGSVPPVHFHAVVTRHKGEFTFNSVT